MAKYGETIYDLAAMLSEDRNCSLVISYINHCLLSDNDSENISNLRNHFFAPIKTKTNFKNEIILNQDWKTQARILTVGDIAII